MGVERHLRPLEHQESLIPVSMKPSQGQIQTDLSGFLPEYRVEAGRQVPSPGIVRLEAIGFEVFVQRPDLAPHALHGRWLERAARVQRVKGPLGMNPAQAMPQPRHRERAGIVADDGQLLPVLRLAASCPPAALPWPSGQGAPP